MTPEQLLDLVPNLRTLLINRLRSITAPRVILKVVKNVAPFCTGVLCWRALALLTGYYSFNKTNKRPPSLLWRLFRFLVDGWLVSESLFYFYCSIRKIATQRQNKMPDQLSRKERVDLFERCLETVTTPQQFTVSWFRNHAFHKLKLGNIEEWLSWGVFSKTPEELIASEHIRKLKAIQNGEPVRPVISPDQIGDKSLVENDEASDYDQLQYFISRIEDACDHKFPPGHDGQARLMRFNFEPIESHHRPLLYYGVVEGVFQNIIVPTYMRVNGFTSRTAPTSGLYCWFRQGVKDDRPPIVFIHGIGVGLLPYLGMADRLVKAVKGTTSSASSRNLLGGEDMVGRSLIFVELPIVAQAITKETENNLLLRGSFAHDMEELLHICGYQQAAFVGHSFGTICLSWIVSSKPEIVSSLVFIDPVVFLLHHTRAVENIVYSEPQNDMERLMHYILRSELIFNVFTRRYFFWYANILFLDQIPTRCKTTILLSECDDIVPTDAVDEYITNYKARVDAQGEPLAQHVKVVLLKNAQHGEYLWNSKCSDMVLNSIQEMA